MTCLLKYNNIIVLKRILIFKKYKFIIFYKSLPLIIPTKFSIISFTLSLAFSGDIQFLISQTSISSS